MRTDQRTGRASVFVRRGDRIHPVCGMLAHRSQNDLAHTFIDTSTIPSPSKQNGFSCSTSSAPILCEGQTPSAGETNRVRAERGGLTQVNATDEYLKRRRAIGSRARGKCGGTGHPNGDIIGIYKVFGPGSAASSSKLLRCIVLFHVATRIPVLYPLSAVRHLKCVGASIVIAR